MSRKPTPSNANIPRLLAVFGKVFFAGSAAAGAAGVASGAAGVEAAAGAGAAGAAGAEPLTPPGVDVTTVDGVSETIVAVTRIPFFSSITSISFPSTLNLIQSGTLLYWRFF